MAVTGSWEDSAVSLAGLTVTGVAGWVDAHPGLTQGALTTGVGVSAAVVAYYAYRGVRVLLRSAMRKTKHAYHRVRKLPIMQRARRVIMAKWEQGLLADIIHDALFEKLMRDEITDKQYRKFTKKVGKDMGLPDLLPKRVGKAFIHKYLKERYQKLAGPKTTIPGGAPSLHIPIHDPDTTTSVTPNVVSRSKFMQKLEARKTA